MKRKLIRGLTVLLCAVILLSAAPIAARADSVTGFPDVPEGIWYVQYLGKIMQAQAQLEANLAEPINGSYIGIIHPYAAYDLMRSEEFIEWHKYAQPGELYRGEIGMIGNVRFVKSTEAKIVEVTSAGSEVGADEPAAGGADSGADSGDDSGVTTTAVFLTMILGKDAYATTYATGLGLEHIVKPLGSGDDPLNQRCTAGWKATKTALRIKEQNMIRIESAGHFSATAKAN